MDAVVAVYSDWGIGDGTTQPVVLKADRSHFKTLTDGAAVIVGRKTLEDFPNGKPLAGRNNIVVTKQDITIEGAEVVHTTDEALKCAEKYDRCLVIGGESIFNQFLPYMDYIFVTKIKLTPESTKFFHNLDEDSSFKCTFETDERVEGDISYTFCTYKRVK